MRSETPPLEDGGVSCFWIVLNIFWIVLNISVLADDSTVDDPHEVTDAMVSSFADIRAAAGFTGTDPARAEEVQRRRTPFCHEICLRLV
jgi:hypothetical protein